MQGCISGRNLTTFCVKGNYPLYNYDSFIKLIITIHFQISNYPVPNMWYIIQKHTIVTIAGIVIPYSSEPSCFITQLLRCWDQPSFSLSGRDGDSNRFSPAGNLFLTQTQIYQPRQSQVTFGTTQVHISRVRTAPHNLEHQMPGCSGQACPWAQSDRSPEGAHNRTIPGLS